MCILNDDCAVVKNGQLKLWKVVRKDNVVGLWAETYNECNQIVFTVGVNTARNYGITAGRYHCFFTRNAARAYLKHRRVREFYHNNEKYDAKIIRVYADTENVMSIGVDTGSHIPAISVSKMTIKSLKHQR